MHFWDESALSSEEILQYKNEDYFALICDSTDNPKTIEEGSSGLDAARRRDAINDKINA